MEKEYIEREAAVAFLEHMAASRYLIQCFESKEKFPAADVVEIVRCRNCKYHHWEQEPCHGKTEHFCSVLNAQVFKDFYCYYGAKMDGKGEGE